MKLCFIGIHKWIGSCTTCGGGSAHCEKCNKKSSFSFISYSNCQECFKGFIVGN